MQAAQNVQKLPKIPAALKSYSAPTNTARGIAVDVKDLDEDFMTSQDGQDGRFFIPSGLSFPKISGAKPSAPQSTKPVIPKPIKK